MIVTEGMLVKVRFQLDRSEWHGYDTEALWAEPIGTAGEAFVLRNSPCHVRGVSFLDVVAAAFNATDGVYEFRHVVARGGHSTYMVISHLGKAEFDGHWNELQAIGCSYESGAFRTQAGPAMLYSIDVPDTTDIHAAYELLEEGERLGLWGFQEGHCGHDVTRPE